MWKSQRVERDPLTPPFEHLGVLSHDDVLDLFHEVGDPQHEDHHLHALFVDLSHWQAFGFTALEAMAEGVVPVVRAGSGSAWRTLHGANAIVVQEPQQGTLQRAVSEASVTEADAFVDAIMHLLRDP